MNTVRAGASPVRPWKRWQNWGTLIAGLWLFFAPWIFHYTAQAAAHGDHKGPTPALDPWNAWIIGGIIVVASIIALGLPTNRLINVAIMAAAVWLFISPWALGFAQFPRVAWDDWIVGVIVFVLALWAWWSVRRLTSTPMPGLPVSDESSELGYLPRERHPVNP